ncbi:hypothetical protein [Flavobacterium sp.]|uniref:hypothetical protein n=1 Tax=Flavobacterium sp. TaxID=239 RepID=UPI0026166DA6|nr:hypothetical protein [Flavobacterium sp.]
MNSIFYNRVAASTAHRAIRDELSGMVLQDTTLLPCLMEIVLNTEDKNHHKACWIAELVFEANLQLLEPYLSDFCKTLNHYRHEGAIRSVSKICLFAAGFNQKTPGFLTAIQLQQVTEACFDWLIDPEGKVAAKAYAIRALYVIGKKQEWIYPELAQIFAQDFPQNTAAYKSAAKDILRKIANHS